MDFINAIVLPFSQHILNTTNLLNLLKGHLYWVLILFVFLMYLSQLHQAVKIYCFQKPNSFIYSRGAGFIGHWFTSLVDHAVASGHIKHAYAQSWGKPFSIPAIGKYKTYITDPKQIYEFESAPPSHLSFNPIVEEQLATHLIFHGFKFDPKDPRHSIPIHSLSILFKKNILSVIPMLKNEVDLLFKKEFGSCQEWIDKRPFSLAQRMYERLTSIVMVGKELADDPKFHKAVEIYIRDSRLAAELLRWTPSILGDIVGRILIEWSGAKRFIFNKLMTVLWERIESGPEEGEKPLDMLQWMLDSTRKKTPQMIERLCQHTMLFFFAGANAPPMLIHFALVNLCNYPEYLEPLQQEIISLQNHPETEEKYASMVLMDSFLKETGRLQPLLSFTVARKTLKPFTFADGTHVPENNWICAPQQVMNLDESNYTSPHIFNPFRFVPPPNGSAQERHDAKFTTPSYNYLFWSGPKRPCTGRFYVDLTTKMILCKFIMLYDFKLDNPNRPAHFAWNHILAPHPFTKVLFKKKDDTQGDL